MYGSVCSGLEAASVAWAPLCWEAAFVSEIEAFPCAVLAHHYPAVPNRGDLTKFKEWPDDAIDLLVGGTPCQSFSVAGLRAGLADPRGNLMLTYLALASERRPRWVVWENVPGVLSSNGGRDFGTFLRGLGELGYGFAYRVLDAQFCRAHGLSRAVPQRRRRVFVVGHSGDWRRAAAVLFDSQSLRGDSTPRREPGQGIAPTISSRPTGGGGLGTDFDLDGGLVTDEVARCDTAGYSQRIDAESENFVAHALRADGFDASEDGTGRGTPLIAFSGCDNGQDAQRDYAPTLRVGSGSGKMGGGQQMAVAFAQNQRDEVRQMDVVGALASEPGMKQQTYLSTGWAVRRLTPTECERLQGFPDGYTAIPYRGKQAADGPRYKALGNSMAVNVMRVIGERIALVEAIPEQARAAA